MAAHGRERSLEDEARTTLLKNYMTGAGQDAAITEDQISQSAAMALTALHPLDRPPYGSDSQEDLSVELEERLAAPDQFIQGYETSKWELWSYYAYYVGNTGLGPYVFASTAFQNLLSQAAGDAGVLRFAGSLRTIDSIVLLSNGISFSIQAVLFLVIGSYADFGTWRPYILIVATAIAIAVGFAWLGIHTFERWEYAAGLYIVGLIVYQLSYAYWLAAFPRLARNTPALRECAEKYSAGEISREEYDAVDSMKRNEICNTGLYFSSMGAIPLVTVGIVILYGLHSNDSTENNSWGLSVLISWSSAYWLVFAIPWFVLEKRRPGQPLPPGLNFVTAGLWQIYRAAIQIWRLKQTLAYLIGFFFLGDALGTSTAVVNTLQNATLGYNIILLCELVIVGLVAQTIGISVFMYVQRKYNSSTKDMLKIIAISVVALDVYGMIGIWIPTLGFHQQWEFWLYQVWFGLMACPWYSYSQTMISEVVPRGKEFLFFSLFNIVGKASSFIGPLISSAIIDLDPSHNNSAPFYFLTALSAVGFGIIWLFVDPEKSRREQEEFLSVERMARRRLDNH